MRTPTDSTRLAIYRALPKRYQRKVNNIPHVLILRARGYMSVPLSQLTGREIRRLGRACGIFPAEKKKPQQATR